MNSIKKVVGINILVLIAYTLLINLLSNNNGNERGMEVAILMMVAVAIHVGILLLAMLIYFVSRKNAEGRTFLLSALIVLVIGFSACLGSLSFY